MKTESQPDQDPDQRERAKDSAPGPGQTEEGFYTDGAGWMWAILILSTLLWIAFLLWYLL